MNLPGPLGRYANAIAMALATVIAAAIPLFSGNHHLTQAEMANLVLVFLGTASVYVAPNLPGAPYAKAVIAALTAAATLIYTFLAAGGSIQAVPIVEWLQVALAMLAALGVRVVPNTT